MGDSIDSWLSSAKSTLFLFACTFNDTCIYVHSALSLSHNFPLPFLCSLPTAAIARNTSQDSPKAVSQRSTDGIATIPETTALSSGDRSPEPPVTTDTGGSHDLHRRHGKMPSAPQSDLLKERPEIYVSTSTGDSDQESWTETNGRSAPSPAPAGDTPPPIPPKRGLGKMVSLPPGVSSSSSTTGTISGTISGTIGGHGGGGVPPAVERRLLRGGRTSLPASSITKDLQKVRIFLSI